MSYITTYLKKDFDSLTATAEDVDIQDIAKDGLSYVLYNNVWGTNFPLWYEDNARFVFRIQAL